jgi:carbon monoxide dehydrogenase subunit G
MRTTRSRELATTRERIWEVVGDPYHEPRWWPRVQRVEGVGKKGWTSVLASPRGNAVRVDWTLEESQRPERRRWSQELEGTPFARMLRHNAVELELERTDTGTRVTLTFDQQLRGFARFAPWMVRKAMRRNLDAALSGLAQAVEP